MNFGDKLKALRMQKGLSQQELAKTFNVANSTVGMWEQGRRIPDDKMLIKIAEYFNVSTDFLLGHIQIRFPKSCGSFTVVELIRSALNKKGVDEYDFCLKLKIPIDSLHKWRTGESYSFFDLLPQIAKYLNVSVTDLLGRETDFKGRPLSNPEVYREYIENEKQLAKNAQDIMKGIGKDGLLSDAIPVKQLHRIPIVGTVAAGAPILAEENIEGYDVADIAHPEQYFFLRVKGDSMINAGIKPGDLVLVHRQDYAENGQIVVCIVNGYEATLKRFKLAKDRVVLMPENPEYEPYVLSCEDFENGSAAILGVAVEVKTKLI